MSYEFDPEFCRPPKEEPESLVTRRKKTKGRWKSACHGDDPAVICYGFVFEEDGSEQEERIGPEEHIDPVKE